jgi:hypothetical protein
MTLTINPNEDLGQQIEKLADPLRTRADREAEQLHPKKLDLPPVPFPHSKQVQKVIAEHDKLWGEWAEANAKLVGVLDDYTRADAADDAAIRKAARDGADKSPGRKNAEKQRDALEWAVAVCQAKREAVDKLVASGRLEGLLEAELDWYLRQLRDIGQHSEMMLSALVTEFQTRWSETRALALRTMYSFDHFSPLVRKQYGLSYGPDVFDSIPELKLPNAYQLKLARLNHAITVIAPRMIGAKDPQGE